MYDNLLSERSKKTIQVGSVLDAFLNEITDFAFAPLGNKNFYLDNFVIDGDFVAKVGVLGLLQ